MAERVGDRARVSAVVSCEDEIAVEIAFSSPTLSGTRSLVLAPEDADHLGEAIALIVLVALEPTSDATSDSPSDGPSAEVPAEPSAEAPAESRPSAVSGVERESPSSDPASPADEAAEDRERRFANWEIYGGGFAGGGASSEFLPGLTVGGAYRLDATWSVTLDARMWAPRTTPFLDRGRVELVPFGGRLGVCATGTVPYDAPMTLEAGACPHLFVGPTFASASGFDGDNATRWDARVAVSARVHVTFVWNEFFLRIEGEAGVNLVAPAYFVLVDGVSRVFAEHVEPAWAALGITAGARIAADKKAPTSFWRHAVHCE